METEYRTRVNVPQVADLEVAVELYYSKNELSPADICRLFGCCHSTARLLRRRGREQMEIDHVPTWNPKYVNTEAAYQSWGLDIKKLEAGLSRLRRLKLAETPGGKQ